MHIELLPETTNVIRFPVELRQAPTIDTLRATAPDCRDALNLADAFAMEAPVHDLRDRTDEETASFIALQAPPRGPARTSMLRAMEESAVRRALDACSQAHAARRAANAARTALAAAEHHHSPFWLEALRDKANALSRQAVILLLQAHAASEEAEGVARAVSLARQGEPWLPRNHDDETDALIALGAAIAR